MFLFFHHWLVLLHLMLSKYDKAVNVIAAIQNLANECKYKLTIIHPPEPPSAVGNYKISQKEIIKIIA